MVLKRYESLSRVMGYSLINMNRMCSIRSAVHFRTDSYLSMTLTGSIENGNNRYCVSFVCLFVDIWRLSGNEIHTFWAGSGSKRTYYIEQCCSIIAAYFNEPQHMHTDLFYLKQLLNNIQFDVKTQRELNVF